MEQRSPEWFAARCGIPTASSFNKIITSTGRPSKTAITYMYELLADWLGAEKEQFQTEWMTRGTAMEPEAIAFYEFETGLDVQPIGFITALDGLVGCSPDGMTEHKGLELKCPKASTHVKYLLSGKCPAEYVPQVQGSMWVAEKDEWDFMSYHPDLDPLLITVKRDDEFIDALEVQVKKFIANMLEKRLEFKP